MKPATAIKIMLAVSVVCVLWTALTAQFWQWPVAAAGLAAAYAFGQYGDKTADTPVKPKAPRKGRKK